ncbi:unnamed protein product [Gongylonema pulchrum]|uniref:Str_synth domain-containing protein n=1 Tax=Gongylonema pulchrum TaxID=637853 RepID=A0A183DPV9_9BILA|nr:unnamed protein product [Gongylonema pulchrum]
MDRKLFALSCLAGAVAVIVFVLPRSTLFVCEPFQLRQPPKLEGALAVNDILTKVEYILKDNISGPESILVDGGIRLFSETIQTGTQDGRILSIEGGVIRKVFRFGSIDPELCDGGFDSEAKCGRPLGLRRMNAENTLAVDTHTGIYMINFAKGQHTMILRSGTEVNGKPLKFLNDIEVVNDDVLLFTDSSTRWDRRYVMNILLEGIPNGRVLRMTRSTGQIETVMDRLFFANGIQLFPDKESFLVAETGAARIKRHWIAGPKTGETEIFVDNLPGLPDNIRPGTGETFWVALAAVRHSGRFSMYDFLADKPSLRKCILQLIPGRHGQWLLSRFRVKHSLIIRLDKEGRIIQSAHDPTGEAIEHVSEVTEAGDHLYLGSFVAPYIARLPKHLTVM